MSTYRIFALMLFVSLSFSLSAQVESFAAKDGSTAKQIGVSDQALFDRLMLTVAEVGSNSRMTQQQQNLKPYMMPVRNMGFRGSDWSYMLASCLEYYVNLRKNLKENLSPDYISLSLQSQGTQANMVEGLKFLTQVGTVNAVIVPYDAAQIPQAVYATNKYSISNYLHLFQSFASQREKIFEVRKALMRGNPVLLDIKADGAFARLGNTVNWEAPKQLGQHNYTVLIVGFDENKQAFEVMGSWGNTWANNGYLWMSYNDLANAAMNAYVMIPQP